MAAPAALGNKGNSADTDRRRTPAQAQALPSVLISRDVAAASQPKKQRRGRATRATSATVRIELPADLRLGPGGALPAPLLRAYGPRSKVPLRAIGLSLGALVICAAAYLWWQTRDGEVRIEVSTVAGGELPEARVFVDGRLACERSPCVHTLAPGVHRVRAEAPGMEPTAEGNVQVGAGAALRHQIELLPVEQSNPGTLVVLQGEEPLILSVDGRPIGLLPQRLEGLEPGTHKLRFTVPESSRFVERTVAISANQILQLQGQPPAKPGRLELRLHESAEGAVITLDGQAVSELPASLPAEAGTHILRATKPGFGVFEQRLKVVAGQVQQLEVQLTPSK